MRDLERWKDQVELSLDGRRIFFLFFGSAVVACVIFVAGVFVGKRIEQHAVGSSSMTAEDPLAALDRLGANVDDDSLTYHETLTRNDRHGRRIEPQAAARPRIDLPAIEVTAGKPEPKPEVRPPDPARPATHEILKTALAAPPVARPAVSDGKVAALPTAKKADEHFTLQILSFAEKSDAEAFLRRMQSAGYKPVLAVTEIPERGTFYRVRIGEFSSRQAALDAKNEFERKQHLVAYLSHL